MKIGDMLIRRRKELGLTIEEVAERAKINVNSIIAYEKNERLPRIDKLGMLVQVLGLDYDEIHRAICEEKEHYGN